MYLDWSKVVLRNGWACQIIGSRTFGARRALQVVEGPRPIEFAGQLVETFLRLAEAVAGPQAERSQALRLILRGIFDVNNRQLLRYAATSELLPGAA